MGFQVTFENGVIIFVCGEEFTSEDFNQFLGILGKLLDKKEPFVFVINATKPKNIPLKAPITLIKWMKKNKPRIPGILVGSSVIFKNPKISALLNWAFQKQKPVSPNIITTDPDKAYKFVKDIIDERK